MNDERLNLPSASTLHRVMQCPGSFRLEQQCPNQTNEHAERGTRIHQWLNDQSTHLTEDELDLAHSCEIVRNILLKEWCGNDIPEVYSKETRLYLREGLVPIASGQEDITYTCNDHFLIIDYKTGRIAPESVESNYQLRLLAVLLADDLDAMDVEWEDISCAIVQPSVTWSPCLVTYTREHIKAAKEEILEGLKASNQVDSPLIPSIEACRYCRAKAICPALVDKTRDLAVVQDLPKEWTTKEPEDKKALYDLSKMAVKCAEEIQRLIKEDLKAGEQIPGLTLKKGQSKRTVDPSKAWEPLKFYLKPEDYIECCSLTIGQLQHKFHLARCKSLSNDKLTKKSSKELLDDLIKDAVTLNPVCSSIVEQNAIEGEDND